MQILDMSCMSVFPLYQNGAERVQLTHSYLRLYKQLLDVTQRSGLTFCFEILTLKR